MHKSLRLHHIYLVSQHVQMQWNHWVYCVFFRLLRPQHLGSNRSRCLANIPTSQSSACGIEHERKAYSCFDSQKPRLFRFSKISFECGKAQPFFFFGARFAAVAGATPMLSLQSSLLLFQKTPQLQNAKGIFLRKCSQCSFFTFIKTGAFFIFSHNMTMNDGIFTYSDIFWYMFVTLLCFVTHFFRKFPKTAEGTSCTGEICFPTKSLLKSEVDCEDLWKTPTFLAVFFNTYCLFIYTLNILYFLFKMKIGETQSFNILW